LRREEPVFLTSCSSALLSLSLQARATRITDSTGTEVRRLAYTAFGEEAENTGTGDTPKYTYTGKELDTIGLYYYGARYYDPVLARFLTPDTEYDGPSPQGLDRYSYALNNPIIYRDPTGHEAYPRRVETKLRDIAPLIEVLSYAACCKNYWRYYRSDYRSWFRLPFSLEYSMQGITKARFRLPRYVREFKFSCLG
jgi:RHS repeat-associated protein